MSSEPPQMQPSIDFLYNLPAPFSDFYLTPLFPTDFPRLVHIFNHTDLSTSLIHAPYPYTLSDAEYFYKNMATKPLASFPQYPENWIIRSKAADGLLIGCVGVHPDKASNPTSDDKDVEVEQEEKYVLGYYLVPNYRGKRIMPVAVKEVFSHLPGIDITATARRDNAASQAVLQKLGFEKVEGYEEEIKWPESKGGQVHILEKYIRK